MNNINICIAGLGNVGSALMINLIEKNFDHTNIENKIKKLIFVGISAKNKNKKRNV